MYKIYYTEIYIVILCIENIHNNSYRKYTIENIHTILCIEIMYRIYIYICYYVENSV